MIPYWCDPFRKETKGRLNVLAVICSQVRSLTVYLRMYSNFNIKLVAYFVQLFSLMDYIIYTYLTHVFFCVINIVFIMIFIYYFSVSIE